MGWVCRPDAGDIAAEAALGVAAVTAAIGDGAGDAGAGAMVCGWASNAGRLAEAETGQTPPRLGAGPGEGNGDADAAVAGLKVRDDACGAVAVRSELRWGAAGDGAEASVAPDPASPAVGGAAAGAWTDVRVMICKVAAAGSRAFAMTWAGGALAPADPAALVLAGRASTVGSASGSSGELEAPEPPASAAGGARGAAVAAHSDTGKDGEAAAILDAGAGAGAAIWAVPRPSKAAPAPGVESTPARSCSKPPGSRTSPASACWPGPR